MRTQMNTHIYTHRHRHIGTDTHKHTNTKYSQTYTGHTHTRTCKSNLWNAVCIWERAWSCSTGKELELFEKVIHPFFENNFLRRLLFLWPRRFLLFVIVLVLHVANGARCSHIFCWTFGLARVNVDSITTTQLQHNITVTDWW